MSEVLLSLSIAFVFLTALLLLTLIFSRIHWSFKAGLVLVATVFYWFSYQGWKETQGWPTATDIPEKFLLHFAVIEEPDEEKGTSGDIYIWLTDLNQFELAEQPRAYRLDYDQGTHGKVADALREMQNGNLQIGEVKPASELKQSSKDKKRVGSKYPGLEFVKLPDPALPEK